MPILEICCMMLLLDCSNPIVIYFMASKRGAFIHHSPDKKHICISWNKSVRDILKLPYTTHIWILGPLLGQPHIHCQLQQRTFLFYVQYRVLIIHWVLLIENMQATMQIYLLVITLHILEIVTILPHICVENVIRPLRLDNEYDYFRT